MASEAGNLSTCFSPDGRSVFANGGPAAPVPSELRHGLVLSVHLDTRTGTLGGPVHRVVVRLRTGYIPKGLSVSPDGRLLVTT